MLAEKLAYPYVPGERGIPFDDLIRSYKSTGTTVGVICGGSGAEMIFKLDRSYISVEDTSDAHRGMAAEIEDGVVRFVLQTRDFPSEEAERQSDPHPDMFAARFVPLALGYFEGEGHDVVALRAKWVKNSVNLNTFRREMQSHGDKVRAVCATWSGRVFSSVGFSRVEEREIKEINATGINVMVSAIFRRPYAMTY